MTERKIPLCNMSMKTNPVTVAVLRHTSSLVNFICRLIRLLAREQNDLVIIFPRILTFLSRVCLCLPQRVFVQRSKRKYSSTLPGDLRNLRRQPKRRIGCYTLRDEGGTTLRGGVPAGAVAGGTCHTRTCTPPTFGGCSRCCQHHASIMIFALCYADLAVSCLRVS